MTGFLIFISFTLNILAFAAIINLFLRQNRLKETEVRQQKAIEEMEEVISAYLTQMKEENDQFIEKLANLKTAAPAELSKANQAERIVTEQLPEIEENNYKARLGKTNARFAISAYKQQNKREASANAAEEPSSIAEAPQHEHIEELNSQVESVEEATTEQNKTSDFQQIMNLHHIGLSAEEIAKTLSKGKTEIELVLKFNGNR